ncbi:unnamed protein product [Mytilus coruscus]|uniref:Uncharacterized protein n=1 Tax=Mytilus coruscus TaxID=42192 RepID=A0A6J8ECM1_MYTCO|nr:unnamed protein product [Mytilus coruscus]
MSDNCVASSGSGKSKRTAHLSPSSNLHIWVSQWSRKDVEKELQIFCSGTAVTPSSILEKITNEELSEKQSEYMEKVKRYLNFDIKFMELILSQSVAHYPATGITQHLKDVIKDTIERSMKDPDRFVRSTIREFMIAVQTLTRKCEEYRTHLKKTIYEGTFAHFISDFAVLCCLKPECTLYNAKGEPSMWENFRGLQCAISNPDIRLMKRGLPEEFCSSCEETEWPVVSIVEVNMPSDLKFMNESGRDSVDELARRMEFTKLKPSAGNSSSSESTSSDNLSADLSRVCRKKKSSSNVTISSRFLPIYNSNKVFGKHAGELLFELNRCLKDSNAKVGRMPGMIIDGVKVIFTLLEIRVSHLEKLRKKQKLDDDDKALIYYSIPYDIFNQTDRNIVMEYFIKLNNVKSYGYSELEKTPSACEDSAYLSDVDRAKSVSS